MGARVIVSCEHASNRVPEAYADWFAGADEVLASHRGWDPGALGIAAFLANRFEVALIAGEQTRLLIELNRTLGNAQLWSEYSKDRDAEAKQALIDAVYLPYRDALERKVAEAISAGGLAVHLSSHTFTPLWNGKAREVDIGLLFDPARTGEAALCAAWGRELEARLPGWRIRFNEPYSGTDDGLTPYFRGRYPESDYLGIEIETSQAIATDPERSAQAAVALAEGLAAVL